MVGGVEGNFSVSFGPKPGLSFGFELGLGPSWTIDSIFTIVYFQAFTAFWRIKFEHIEDLQKTQIAY